MPSIFTLARLHRAAFFFCGCIIVGIFVANWVRVLPSIGMAGLTATGVVYTITHRRIANKSLWRVFGSLTLIFGLHLAAGLHTERMNLHEYQKDILMQLPFLLLPLAFWLLPAMPSRYLRRLWLLLIGITVVAALGATVNYLLDVDRINELYLHSKVMPTEPEHIRFSLLITLAITAGVLLLVHQAVKHCWRPWMIGAMVALALFLHLLAVRSGEMTFYAIGGLAILWLALRRREWKRAGWVMLAIVLLPLVSFLVFPTFRNKIYNTKEDVSKVSQSDEGKNFSLAARVYSYQAAIEVWRDHPLLGVGKPDLKEEMAKRYADLYPEMTANYYIQPHNQFLFNLASYGLLGLAVFCVSFFYPIYWARCKRIPLLVAHYIGISLSFLVEYTLETQIGLAFVVFFLLLALQGSLPCEEEDTIWRPA